jgi:GNAT superfamily N-acetyltransferase
MGEDGKNGRHPRTQDKRNCRACDEATEATIFQIKMITIRTLENSSIKEIAETFNLAFSDYIVPFHLNEEQLERKIKSESVNLSLSPAAFRDDKLVGFILHGQDIVDGNLVMYNAGTGVVPKERGNKITAQLYNYILPQLKKEGASKVILEVITENNAAISTYSKIGFKLYRHLNCFKGQLQLEENKKSYNIKTLDAIQWDELERFWDFEPSWPNSSRTLEKAGAMNIFIGIYDGKTLAGYLVYNPSAKRVQQFAGAKDQRNKGLAQELFRHVANNYSREISIINVDGRSAETNKFLQEIGLQHFISQQEMELKL